MDNEGHDFGRGAACGVQLLIPNADHISREILEGNRLISNELGFPGTGLWVGQIVSNILINSVEAI